MTLMRIVLGATTALLLSTASAEQVQGDAPPPKIVLDQPLPEPLSRGVVVVNFRTANLRVQPVFGAAAVSVTPRAGHLHVSMDDAPWVWAHASEEPVIVHGLAAGPHKIHARLMNPNHQELDEGTVTFHVPAGGRPYGAGSTANGGDAARIIVEAPLAEPLSRGVVFVRYRRGNPGAGEQTRVRVDDAPFHWADASGNPIIVQGLEPGAHSIAIQLVDARDQVIGRQAIAVTVPSTGQHR
jgi:hypothetical protein